MSRFLSALESQLILRLEWEKQPVVTIEETMAILGVSNIQRTTNGPICGGLSGGERRSARTRSSVASS